MHAAVEIIRYQPHFSKWSQGHRGNPSPTMDTIFGNGSLVNQTSPWQPQPTFRGTFGILSTCLVTLGLCAWSAIHLNMPARNEAPWDFIYALSVWKNAREKRPWCYISWPGQTLRKTAWALLGFFTPELVRCSPRLLLMLSQLGRLTLTT